MTSSRREFLNHVAALWGSIWLAGAALADPRRASRARRSLRVLILGGTGFIGPHYVRAAIARGHRVAVFNRGKDKADLPAQVERLTGDRNRDLTALKGRDWDAVIDLSTYVPAWVRSLGAALHGRVGHYTFISTVSVYDHSGNQSGRTGENSPLESYRGDRDPYTLTESGQYYGALKALCEREAEAQFPGKTLILRPCHIVGPADPVGALTYWAARLQRGREVLAAGDPLTGVHLIDVRDLAQWTLELIERSEAGVFNAAGPAEPMSWGGLLKVLRSAPAAPSKLTWVPTSWLAEHNITSQFSHLLFWASGVSAAGAKLIVTDKARAQGLTLRAVSASAADALAFYEAQSPDRQAKLMLLDGMKDMEACLVREKELLSAWHLDAADR